jgi:hypothetical protein
MLLPVVEDRLADGPCLSRGHQFGPGGLMGQAGKAAGCGIHRQTVGGALQGPRSGLEGRCLAEMLAGFSDGSALVLGIPAGGIAVAAAVAELLHLELNAAVAGRAPTGRDPTGRSGVTSFPGSSTIPNVGCPV